MKVLMLDPSDGNPYGIDLSNAIADAGVDLRLFAAKGLLNRDRVRCTYELIAPLNGPGMHFMKSLQECQYLAGICWRSVTWRPIVLHVQWVRIRQELRVIRWLRGVGARIVVTAHNPLPHERYPGDINFFRRLYGVADRVIVHEETARRVLIDTLGISAAAIDVIPHGAAKMPVPTELERSTARASLTLPPNAPAFLFFGGLRPYKGYDLLLQAFQDAVEVSGDIHLILAGWGRRDAVRSVRETIASFQPKVRERIRDLLSEDKLLPVDTAEAAMRAADCVVLPYQEISQSGVLWQAFGSGRPVLASAVGGFCEVVREGFNGRLVPAGDKKALSKALLDLAEDRATLLSWGMQARDWALATCSWEAVAAKTIATYEAAMATRNS